MGEILTRQERSEPKPQGAVSLRETFSEMQAGQVRTGEQLETLQQRETEALFLEPCAASVRTVTFIGGAVLS